MKKYEYNYGKSPEGILSTIGGYATETTNFGETAFGILNKSTRDDTNYTTSKVVSSGTATLFSVGNGTDINNRKNIIELKADGTVFIKGVGLYDGNNPDESTDIAGEIQGIHDDITELNEDVDRIDNTIESIHISLDDENLVYTLLVDGEDRGTINIPRDQFLKDASYDEDSHSLVLTFIIRGEDNEEVEKQVTIDMSDLEDIYTNGDGLNLDGNEFSIKVDADTQSYIVVSSNGVKIVGIDERFDDVAEQLETKVPKEGDSTINGELTANGFALPDGTADEVLTADGDSNTLKTINGQTLFGEGEIDLSNYATSDDYEQLQADLQTEITNRTEADTTLQNNIDTEISNRENADTALQDQITQEISDRLTADSTLQSNIDSEASARVSADNDLQSQITQEISNRQSADNTLQDNIDAEASTRLSADEELQSQIDEFSSITSGLESDLSDLKDDLNEEIQNRTNADSELQSQIDGKIDTSEKGVANGVATLDDDGYVTSSQLNLKTVNGESLIGDGDITIDMDLYVVATSLPTSNIDTNKIYVVPGEETESNNIYVEWIYVNDAWEKVGEFKPDVDLSNYVTFDDVATTSEVGLMSAEDKAKLDGIAEGADAVSVTQTQTSGTEIGQITINGTSTTLYAPDEFELPVASSDILGGIQIGYTENDQNYPLELDSSNKAYVNVPWADTTYNEATTSVAGLMSAEDKTKLDSLTDDGVSLVTTNLPTLSSVTHVMDDNCWIYSSGEVSLYFQCVTTRSNSTSLSSHRKPIPTVTTTTTGVMSAEDKIKLDSIEENANNYTLPVATEEALGGVKTGYTNDLNEHYFPLQLDDEKAYVRHPEGSGWEHIPSGGQSNQILMWDGDGQAAWHSSADLEIVPEQLYAYGVQFDTTVADPELTRVGNMSYHQSLPIQSQIRGCIAQGGKVQYYLDSSDFRFRATPLTQTCTISLASDGDTRVITSSYFADDRFKDAWVRINDNKFQLTNLDHDAQTAEILSSSNSNYDTITEGSYTVEFGSVRNGYDGTVRIYIPRFYIKGSTEGTTCTVYISTSQIDTDYVEQPAILIDAYKATVLREVPENMGYLSTLSVNSAVSICNSETYCRGGSSNSTTYDEYLESDPTRTWLNKGRTYLSLDNERTYARNAGAELLSYEQYKNAIYWLYVIEYANFNSQADYNANLTDSGYRQGGLGAGMTSINSNYWALYNSSTQITPNGYLDEYGTSSAILPLRFEAFDYDFAPATTWSGQSWVNNFTTVNGVSYIITSSDNGATKTITSVPYSGCNIYVYAYKVSGSMSYTIAGLPEGGQIRFATSGQTTVTATADGDYTMDWGTGVSAHRYIYFDFVDTNCSVTITINSVEEEINISLPAQTLTVNRWRGIDCLFGDTWLDVDGILIDANTSGVQPTAYITTNPDNYTSDIDTLKENYTRSLTLALDNGYIKTQHLGNDADIMPETSGGSSSTYMCDYYWITYNATRRLRIGGAAADGGSTAGLGALACNGSPSALLSNAGFRTVNTFES